MGKLSSPRVWLITGCSSGFGEQFVKQLVHRGEKVIATARNVDKIQHLSKLSQDNPPAILQLDITESQEVLNSKAQEAVKCFGQVDILVSNAGFLAVGTLEEVSDDDYMQVMSTNFHGPTRLIRALLPHFRSRRSGTIIFNGSMWGWEGHAANTMYCSAKFALEGLAEGLSKELGHLGIKVMVLEPGFFRTSILAPEKLQIASANIDDYSQINDGLKQTLHGANDNQPGDPERGVKAIIDVVKSEGLADGRPLPLRLPLGSDAIDCLKSKCENTLKLLNEWDGLIKSTDFPQ